MSIITGRVAVATPYRETRQAAEAARARAAGERTATALATLLDLPQEVLDKRKKGAEALAQLEQAHKAGIADRKGAAKQKLEQARARLQMVRMFGGDAKAMARQAKRIAQDIREAAREYGAALQSEGGAAAPAAAPAEASKPEDGEAGPDKIAATYQNAAADMAARDGKARATREDIEKFKDGARDARRLIEEAARRLKAKKAAASDMDELEEARRSMTKAVDELDQAASDRGGGEEGSGPAGLAGAVQIDITV